ncbi:4-amino-4-deoxy-L-arabinose transferase-like glycosyltransferase [Allocatelliglobosispora scoriae]|uniref:4-amino-4-deoxy-L-arabinose transferase-like glycosyltransferase n=1 Tax=Allocatelliglobosispora scoriae TaxID=643052 RepID=A0A841C0G8_9ACTN|nr:glycosyltransferase family 39 protein [Allocatelliglobosispora scoriae]MBB5873874.1 4-amino-4-deoxy-L-arabinose transferase-like glycosyltransferase [Allocatelliglobosispora scoriae]
MTMLDFETERAAAGVPAEVVETPRSSRRPTTERIALAALLVGTGLLYLWNLAASGWGNGYYAAAVQAGTQDWKAMLFGSLDSANFITVDKTPASLWLMEISARIFGFSSWSVLVPQALCGVAAVALTHAAVRRWAGGTAGLIAGVVLALTPVAALMFRFNNPDALLTLLLVAAAYAVTRALERGLTRWLLLAGGLVGLAYLTKMMQAFLVLPALAIVYLVCAPVGVWKRVRQLLAAAGAMIVGAGWWVALVELWPAGSRPYIGGSTGNSILELTLGYNGLSRITGGEGGGPGGGFGGGGGGFGGAAGLLRLFNDTMGAQASWLLPAALIALGGGLWVTARRPRTDAARAGLLLWGTWLITHALVFSLMEGIVHEYYTVAMAPALGALIGGGGVLLWRARDGWTARIILAAAVVVSAWWAVTLLGRADWQPWLAWVVVAAAVIAVAGLLVPARRLALAGAIGALGALLAAPAAYALQTAGTAHTGSTPLAGPATSAGGRGMGGMPGMGGPGGAGGAGRPDGGRGGFGGGSGTAPGIGAAPGSALPGGAGGPAVGGAASGGAAGGMVGGGGFGGGGATSAELTALLTATDTTWAAAVSGAQSAATLELATGKAVMGMGGWSGDPAPTLAQFQQWVQDGQIGYLIGGGQGGGRGGGSSSAISAWVAENYTAKTVGGQTVYDLTAPLS